jgi:hypothetical protein
MGRRWIVLFVSVLVLGAVAPSRAVAGSQVAGFMIDGFSGTFAPGDSFTAIGSGCPVAGSLPTDAPLHLRLTPPTGGNGWGPAFIGDQVGVVSTLAGIAGEVDVQLTPDSDGSFAASITIPTDAPVGGLYSVRGICLSVLEAGDGPNGFTQESHDASVAEAEGITVEVAPIASSSSSTTSTVGATSAVKPLLTG